jgi:hypothetical protein
MRAKLLLCFAIVSLANLAFAVPATMRLDYYHSGNTRQELFSVDRVVIEPLPWPGNMGKTIDDTNLGNYFFEVHDQVSGKLLYSRGFSSIYGEWVTTDEAKKASRTFSESLRFPAPDAAVRIILKKRDGEAFKEVWTTVVDPKDKFVDKSSPPSPGPVLSIQKNGDPAGKVDMLILGDGYTVAEKSKFESDARRFTAILFDTQPFKGHQKDFNVWGLCPPAMESGISRPSSGIQKRNPLGTTYDTFDSERYILTVDNRTLRDVASFAPYEFIEVLTNSSTYGGGGIFNLYATVAADSEWAPYIFVHEFGHHFAGLADEYYTSQVAYAPATTRTEPWEPNATALLDPDKLKWKDLVAQGTPLPTRWHKEEFEVYERDIQAKRRELRAQNHPESEMNALFRDEKEHEDGLLASEQYAGKVGAFEGANYEAHGYYRPEVNCIMFTRHDAFCEVCRRAIERIIAMYSGT